jgi:hypothetical protein
MSLILTAMTAAFPRMRAAWRTSSTPDKLAIGRLVFTGALLGVSAIGTLFWLCGVPQNTAWDLVGAAGGVAAIAAAKLIHV